MDSLSDANLKSGTGPARCFLLNADGDFAFLNGSLVLARGAVAIGQELAMAVRTWLGEWFLDVTEGLRWADVLGRKPADVVEVEGMVRARLARHTSVARVESVEASLSPTSRTLLLSYRVVLTEGTTLENTVEV